MIKRKADHIAIYGIYDTKDDDSCIFVGSRKEVADYFEKTPLAISQAMSNGNIIKKRYEVKFLYYEKLTELECRVCHNIKPLSDFKIRSHNKGHEKICKECYNIQARKYMKKKGGE